MQKQIQQENNSVTAITRAAIEEELGDAYKRCWAYAFKFASEGLGIDDQIENLCKEFDLVNSQAQWFVNGANSILAQKELKEIRQAKQESNSQAKPEQKQLAQFAPKPQTSQRYISQLEMMAFLEDIEEMTHDSEFAEFWDELNSIQQTVLEQNCATEKEVLCVFRIRSIIERAKEETERFFDAYPISTSAWENGHFDRAGEFTY